MSNETRSTRKVRPLLWVYRGAGAAVGVIASIRFVSTAQPVGLAALGIMLGAGVGCILGDLLARMKPDQSKSFIGKVLLQFAVVAIAVAFLLPVMYTEEVNDVRAIANAGIDAIVVVYDNGGREQLATDAEEEFLDHMRLAVIDPLTQSADIRNRFQIEIASADGVQHTFSAVRASHALEWSGIVRLSNDVFFDVEGDGVFNVRIPGGWQVLTRAE